MLLSFLVHPSTPAQFEALWHRVRPWLLRSAIASVGALVVVYFHSQLWRYAYGLSDIGDVARPALVAAALAGAAQLLFATAGRGRITPAFLGTPALRFALVVPAVLLNAYASRDFFPPLHTMAFCAAIFLLWQGLSVSLLSWVAVLGTLRYYYDSLLRSYEWAVGPYVIVCGGPPGATVHGRWCTTIEDGAYLACIAAILLTLGGFRLVGRRLPIGVSPVAQVELALIPAVLVSLWCDRALWSLLQPGDRFIDLHDRVAILVIATLCVIASIVYLSRRPRALDNAPAPVAPP